MLLILVEFIYRDRGCPLWGARANPNFTSKMSSGFTTHRGRTSSDR
jgi:hypothetical protein